MPITVLGNSATGTEIATAVNALILVVENATSGNAALNAKVNSTTIGNTALGTKMTELYDVLALPSENDDSVVTYSIPATEITVTISAVARSFTFNVARFNYAGTAYVSSTVVSHIGEGSGTNFNAAVALITALVAAGSYINTDDEGSGVLTETTA